MESKNFRVKVVDGPGEAFGFDADGIPFIKLPSDIVETYGEHLQSIIRMSEAVMLGGTERECGFMMFATSMILGYAAAQFKTLENPFNTTPA